MTPSQCTFLAPECVALILPRTRLASLDILVATSDPANVEPTTQHQALTPSQRQVCLQLSVSQLVMLEGTSINGIPSTETDHISGLPSFKLARKGGRGVKTACVNCRNVGKRCDPGRPCSRCKRIGLQGCRDAPSKAKKPTGKRIVAGPAPNDPPSTPGTSATMDEAPHPAPVDVTSLTPSVVPEAIDASTQFWVPSAAYPASDAQTSDAYVGPSTFGAGDVGQMAYGYYDDPAQHHLIRYSQTPSPPAVRAVAVVGYPTSHSHAMDMPPEAPQDYFLLNVASASDQSLAGLETHSSSQGPATGIQTPWPGPSQGW